jgi:hypothetical protein
MKFKEIEVQSTSISFIPRDSQDQIVESVMIAI